MIYAYDTTPEIVHVIEDRTQTWCGIDTMPIRWRHTDHLPILNAADAPLCVECVEARNQSFGES